MNNKEFAYYMVTYAVLALTLIMCVLSFNAYVEFINY
jgi:hypothetical protein